MDDLLAGIFTFRGRLFHWFFVLLLLVFYSSTQEGKIHFSLFEDRILTDLEAEINLVDFHKRGIGPGRVSIIQFKSPDIHYVSGLNSLECKRRIFLR